MRVAVLGLGNAGYALHLPALARTPDAEVVGACDVDAERRQRAAEGWRVPVFDDFSAMLERTQPDVVIVATPPATHATYCLRSLAAGAHVICEKPLASSVAEAEAIIASAAAAGRQVAVNHEFREMPIFRAIRDQVGSPEVGELRFAQAWQLMDLPPWRESGWRAAMLPWTLYEAGIHLVDFLMALFGEKPVAVSATTSSCGAWEGRSDAIALATLEFSRERLAQVVQNRLCRGETQYFEVRAEGTRASLRASFGGRARLTVGLHRSTTPHCRFEYGRAGLAWRETGHRRTLLARNPADPAACATGILLNKTFAAFRDGSRPPASAEDGRDVLQVVAACYRAAATGQRVALESGEGGRIATWQMGTGSKA